MTLISKEYRKDIAIFSMTDSLGGAEQILLKIAEFYSKEMRHEVTIYFMTGSVKTNWKKTLGDAVKIVYLKNNLLRLFQLLHKERFKLTFSSHLMINAILGGCRALGVLRTQVLVARESTQVFQRYKGIKLFKYKVAYWLGYRQIDLIVCQSTRMRDSLQRSAGFLFKRAKVEVIPNPFGYPSEVAAAESVPVSENTIVSAGRLIPEKGFDLLIKAFARMAEDNTELRLMILGEGNERANLQQLIDDLELNDRVILFGFVKNIYPYFRKAKVCVVASRMEGFPNTLLQMMSQNTRVVSTLCAGGIEGLTGVRTCRTDSVEALTDAISESIRSGSQENRILFDKLLSDRSVESFIMRIENTVFENRV